MNFRELASHSRASGWQFRTSSGADLSVGLLSASVGEIQVVPLTANDNTPPTRLRYAAIGAGLSVEGLDFSADFSTPSMYSTGLIFTLTGRPLTAGDFIGGSVVVSATIPFNLTGMGDGRNMMSCGLFFFGAPMHLTANNAVREAAEYVPGLFGILPEVGALIAGQGTSYFWRSFKGFAAIVGEICGVAMPGITYLRGVIPQRQTVDQAQDYVRSWVRSLDPRRTPF
jgi:hypothetical protein